jgi:hypothetical protein
MDLTVQIPDDLASRMSASGGDLSRRALEALLAKEPGDRELCCNSGPPGAIG